MKKIDRSLFILLLLSIISCSTVKESSSSRVVKEPSSSSDKTVINYNRTISAGQAKQIAQLLKNKLSGFPDDSLPIKFENNTAHSNLNIHLKKKKVKLKFRSNLNNQEVRTIQQIKETIARI